LLKSSLSDNLFQSFVSSYQNIPRSSYSSDIPFVFVDTEGGVKLLTNVVENDDRNDGVFAVSMAEDGWMEFLALQD
tara:strand:+ start:86942 stop:87169 length:228 start_codon:yes stop_codon:yes gene_type:complete